MMFRVEKNNLYKNHKFIKNLEIEEINPARKIAEILNNYDLEPEDININQTNYLEDIEDIDMIIIILLLADYYNLEVFRNINLDDLISNITRTIYNFDTSINNYLDTIKESLNLNDTVERYFDYSQLIYDQEVSGELTGYIIKHKENRNIIARFIIPEYEKEDIFYNLKI